jgi:tRNA-2-methylthio-N6-dimethylallyladenosine synthase
LTQKRPNIELFFRIDDTGFLPLMLNRLWYSVDYDQELINEYINIVPEDMNTSMNNHHKTAYVPISTGCNQFCSYCIVPYARWLEKHLPLDKIIAEVERHLAKWVEEIVLLWQIVNKHPQFACTVS